MVNGLDTWSVNMKQIMTYMRKYLDPLRFVESCLEGWADIYGVVLETRIDGFVEKVIDNLISCLEARRKGDHLTVNVGSKLTCCGLVKMVSKLTTIRPRRRRVLQIRNAIESTCFINEVLGKV